MRSQGQPLLYLSITRHGSLQIAASKYIIKLNVRINKVTASFNLRQVDTEEIDDHKFVTLITGYCSA